MNTDHNKDELKYILNEKNKYITREYIESTLLKFGINIKIGMLEVFQQAMIHLSYLVRDERFYSNNKTKPYQIQSNDIEPLDDISKAIQLQKESYERLEFLGDAILHAILAEYLFNRYEKEDEGFMTKLRTKIENGDALSILSKIIGLNEYVVISRYVEKNGGRETNKAVLEDVFEAFIGALYSEVGYEVCRTFIITLIEKEIDLAQLLYQETNFKERLLQYFHLRKWLDPIYGVLDVSGPENKKMYTMYVKCRKTHQDEGEIVGIGVGTSKKNGEQNSAKQSLIQYGLYKEDDDSECDSVEEMSDSEEIDEFISNSDDDEFISDDEDEDDKINKGKKCKKEITIENVKEQIMICLKCKKEFKRKTFYDKHMQSCGKK